jgi:hypothetical protein
VNTRTNHKYIEQALENQEDNHGDILDVPFVFNRTTEVGQNN